MASKPARSGAPKSSKPRHSAAQKKAARLAREQDRPGRRSATGSGQEKAPRWSAETRAARGRRPTNRGRDDTGMDSPPQEESRSERGGGGRNRHESSSTARPRREPSSGERPRHDRSYAEHSFRSHREEISGRPDRRDRSQGAQPSRRDRAQNEIARGNRSERGPRNRAEAAPAAQSGEQSAQPRQRGQALPVPARVTADNGFAALGLRPDLVAALARQGIVDPFPIQSATIPDALAGRDLLGRGQTGSGKTMAFGLPALHRLAEIGRARPRRPHAVILTPTRELASQIVDALRPLSSALGLRQQLIAGGMSYTPQLRALDEGTELLVATPGRLSDLIERGAADLSQVQITVLDEADHMAEMGFVEAISEILDLTPSHGQRLLFSATLDHGVDKVAQRYLTDPVTHSTDDASASVSTMEHRVFLVHPHDKKTVTAQIANRSGRTLVFVRTKLGADRVALQLRESGVFAAALHGGLNQAQRTRVLEGYKAGQIPVLVATDVAARGIHVDEVSLVLQVDPPADHKDYLHRSGRTARAGEAGLVVTLALPHQRRVVSRLLESAGVQTEPVDAGPSDHSVLSIAGGRVPTGESIPQSRLDDLLRPPRRGGARSGGRGGRERAQGAGYRSGRGGGRGRPASGERRTRDTGGTRGARGAGGTPR